jgi:integrase
LKRHQNDGLRKRCGCKRRDWSKCSHPWHLNFQWEGHHYRLSLDREVAPRRLLGKTDAETEAGRIQSEIRAGTFIARKARRTAVPAPAAGETLTFRAFGEKFIERYSKARGKASIEDDRYMLERVCAFTGLSETPLGDKALAAVTADDAEHFLENLRARGRAGSTYNHYRQLLLNMFRWGTRKAFLTRNPLEHAELPRQPQAKRSRRLTEDEETRLLTAAAWYPHVYRLIVGALETGCRQGELLQLLWRDVDLTRQELRVRAEHAKDAEERVLPISTRLKAVLEMARTDPTGKEAPGEAFVFGDAVGGALGSFKKAWQATLLRANGVEPVWKGGHGKLTPTCVEALRAIDLHFHDLRHEAGSRWLEGGMPIHHVKELLGHSNIKTTDTYLNATRLGLRESMRKFEESRTSCTLVAQTPDEQVDAEGTEERPEDPQTPVPSGLISGGVDEARTRDLRRDRPAF